MLTWLRRWLAPAPPEPIDSRAWADLNQRLDALDAKCDYLWAAHRKLRGRVTGGLRSPDPDGTDGGPVGDAPAVGNPRAIELLRKRGRA